MTMGSFAPLLVIFGVLVLLLGSAFLTRKLMIRRDQRSRIKQDMLRGPGH